MTSDSEGGLLNEYIGITGYSSEAITRRGQLVKLDTSGLGPTGINKYSICDAGEEPDGAAFITTLNAITRTYDANKEFTVNGLVTGIEIGFPLADTHAAIEIGDKLAVVNGGTVDKYTSGAAWLVGKAEQPKAQNEGGHVRVRVFKEEKTA
jgi:hypothetical protein